MNQKINPFILGAFVALFLLSCDFGGVAGGESLTASSSSFSSSFSSSSNHSEWVNPLNLEQIPQFIFLGSDDNNGNGMPKLMQMASERQNPTGNGVAATFDGEIPKLSFYSNTIYESESWYQWHKDAAEAGHEIGNHTHSHPHQMTSKAIAKSEIDTQDSKMLAGAFDGVRPEGQMLGFRTPYLEVTDTLLTVVREKGYLYDCSIEAGYADSIDGSNMPWPYSLENGLDVHWQVLVDRGVVPDLLEPQPGFWEIPVAPLIAPTDSAAKVFGVEGLRNKLLNLVPDLESKDHWKLTGFDYNFWELYQFTPAEFSAVLKYNLDLRLKSNKAPLSFGMHSVNYGSGGEDKLAALTDFVDYALSKSDVRFISGVQLINWMKNPIGFNGQTVSIPK